mmetsp:Transcript_14245/g.34741  ORF Transcript_14245/g.34741 Transcript_14245/m.34741 type:complete len:231 (+) Transcript_14245:1429-2121(+)
MFSTTALSFPPSRCRRVPMVSVPALRLEPGEQAPRTCVVPTARRIAQYHHAFRLVAAPLALFCTLEEFRAVVAVEELAHLHQDLRTMLSEASMRNPEGILDILPGKLRRDVRFQWVLDSMARDEHHESQPPPAVLGLRLRSREARARRDDTAGSIRKEKQREECGGGSRRRHINLQRSIHTSWSLAQSQSRPADSRCQAAQRIPPPQPPESPRPTRIPSAGCSQRRPRPA